MDVRVEAGADAVAGERLAVKRAELGTDCRFEARSLMSLCHYQIGAAADRAIQSGKFACRKGTQSARIYGVTGLQAEEWRYKEP